MHSNLQRKISSMESCRGNNHAQDQLKQWFLADFGTLDLPRSVHVAGTNGKGSVIAWLEALLSAKGISSGSFISPHLISHNERIRINGQPISLEEWETIYDQFEERFGQRQMTMFEMDLWMAAAAFQKAKPKWILMETGLGGSRDATTILNYPLGIITHIGLEHMAFLGNTRPEIAQAKAGIIFRDMNIVTAEKDPECLTVFSQRAASQRAALIPIDAVSYDFSGFWKENLPAYQKDNFLCALAALEQAGMTFSLDELKKAVDHFHWAGRFDLLRSTPLLILDGAHNPDGIAALVGSLQKQPMKIDRIYFSVLADKQAGEMIRDLQAITACITLVEFESGRIADLKVLAKEYGLEVIRFDQMMDRLQQTDENCAVCGSLYFAGEVLRGWKAKNG